MFAAIATDFMRSAVKEATLNAESAANVVAEVAQIAVFFLLHYHFFESKKNQIFLTAAYQVKYFF